MTLEQAYPGIAFRSRSRNWWARLTRVPAECVHLERDHIWMATLVPDAVYLQGRATAQRDPQRPEVSLCRSCLLAVLAAELAQHCGRVVAFEPDADSFSQYFFVASEDFGAAGLDRSVAAAIQRRLDEPAGVCAECSAAAKWLWVGRNEVSSLDEVDAILAARGRRLCLRHGAEAFCAHLESIGEANLFYMNVPYGDAGAYVWI